MKRKKLSDAQLVNRCGAAYAELYQRIGNIMFDIDEQYHAKKVNKKKLLDIGTELLKVCDFLTDELHHWDTRINTYQEQEKFGKLLDEIQKKLDS